MKAPYQSKILVFVDGKNTMDFLKDKVTIDGYEFVNVHDYKPDPDVGQLILLTDKDIDELSNIFTSIYSFFDF